MRIELKKHENNNNNIQNTFNNSNNYIYYYGIYKLEETIASFNSVVLINIYISWQD